MPPNHSGDNKTSAPTFYLLVLGERSVVAEPSGRTENKLGSESPRVGRTHMILQLASPFARQNGPESHANIEHALDKSVLS